MKTNTLLFLLVFVFVFTACGGPETPPAFVLTPPAISLQLIDENCPSIEVQPGMQIAWTNLDTKDRLLIVQRVDAQGNVVDSGGTDLLQPGSTFSIVFDEEGQYTYFCTLDRKASGAIKISSGLSSPSVSMMETPRCDEKNIPPVITEILPAQPQPGSEITVIGTGGYIQDSCGGVNESARLFPLYLDQEVVGDLQCYINHCEVKIRLQETITTGTHCFSLQPESCEFEFQVAGS